MLAVKASFKDISRRCFQSLEIHLQNRRWLQPRCNVLAPKYHVIEFQTPEYDLSRYPIF